MNKLLKNLSYFAMSSVLLACNSEKSVTESNPIDTVATEDTVINANADQIIVVQKGLYPEGIDYDSNNNRFFLTSLRTGNIGYVNSAGEYVTFIEDDSIASAIGCFVDEDRNRLLVACSDPGVGMNTVKEKQGKTAKLGIFNLETGEKEALIDLTTLNEEIGYFANDIAVDGDGQIYITNSFAPEIYTIVDNEPAIYLYDEAFAVEQGQFGLNGIAYHPDGYLLVAKDVDKELYKINMEDQSVTLVMDSLPGGPDGIELIDNKTIAVVCNAGNKVLQITSEDNWNSASVTGSFDTPASFPTTATLKDGDLYVLYANLGKLFGGDVNQESYPIQKVKFN